MKPLPGDMRTSFEDESNLSGSGVSSIVILLAHVVVLIGFAAILARYYRFGAMNVWLTALPAMGVFLAGASRAVSGRGLALLRFRSSLPPWHYLRFVWRATWCMGMPRFYSASAGFRCSETGDRPENISGTRLHVRWGR